MKLRMIVRQLLRRVGYDVFYTHEKFYIIKCDDTAFPFVRRMKLLRQHHTNLILDVGASNGG